uniref:Uncharacterized protein n=1 Tax=viral metagenome TaxID=1070528 RepID=A0A6C0LRD5_9ZZZZ
MGRQYTRKHKGGESQQELLLRLTEDAVKITKDIEALRDSLKLQEVSKKEDKVEPVLDGLSDMFSTETFDEQSEAAKKSKKELDVAVFKLFNSDLRKLIGNYKQSEKEKQEREGRIWVGNREKLIQDLRNKIGRLINEKRGDHTSEIESYKRAIEGIEKATTVDEIKNAFYQNKSLITIGTKGQIKLGGKTKKLQKKSKKTQRKSHKN